MRRANREGAALALAGGGKSRYWCESIVQAVAGRGLTRVVMRALPAAAALALVPLGAARAQGQAVEAAPEPPPAAAAAATPAAAAPAAAAPAASAPAAAPTPASGSAPSGGPSAAEDGVRTKARALGYAGVEAYAGGDYAAASAKLEESFQLLPVPSLGLWSARALVGLGRWVEAERRYRAVAALAIAPGDSPVQQSAKEEAQHERAELLRRIPSLKVRVAGASLDAVRISVDGAPRRSGELETAILLDPGRHELVGVHGSERSQVVLNLAERAHEEVELRFSGGAEPVTPAAAAAAAALPAPAVSALPLPSPATSERASSASARQLLRVGGWAALGAGAAGLATSLVSYLIADRQYSGFERRDLCADGGCSQDEVDTYNDLRAIHQVSLIAGGVATVAGATLVVLTWGDPERRGQTQQPQTLRLELGPASALLSGSF